MLLAARWMELVIILSEGSQEQKDKYHTMSLVCGISNMIQVSLFTKQKQTQT